jgi:hypothetical protein
LRPVVVAAALAVALAFVLLPGGDDDTGEQASPPPPKPYVVKVGELLQGDLASLRRLQAEFEARGARLVIKEQRVAPNAQRAGQVVGLQTPNRTSTDRLVVEELTGPVVVTIAVPDPDEKVEGLTICQTIPALNDLMDGDDPDGSVRRLREAGFDVTVKTVPWDKPGDEDIIIGVYGPGGRNSGVPPDTKKLTVEVGSPGEGHAEFGSC